MPKRSPEEVWRQLVDEAGEDEIERAASVSVAQAEKELAKAGFDVAAERAKAETLMRELEALVSGKVAIAVPVREPPMAQPLDPAGEATPEVRTLRKTIDEAPPTTPPKPPPINDKSPGTK